MLKPVSSNSIAGESAGVGTYDCQLSDPREGLRLSSLEKPKADMGYNEFGEDDARSLFDTYVKWIFEQTGEPAMVVEREILAAKD
ncbi:MAG: hypothetical protein ACON5D_19610 [Rubripirellula sp.]